MRYAPAILDSLAGLGLIAEVIPGTEQAREFARSYRLHSLLMGLGNTPDEVLVAPMIGPAIGSFASRIRVPSSRSLSKPYP